MAKKSDYSLFINFFFNSLKKLDYSLFLRPSIFTIHYFFGPLFTIHYKKGPLFTNHYTPSRPSYIRDYNPFLVYCRELAPSTVSLTGDRAQGDDSKHDLHCSAFVFLWVFLSKSKKEGKDQESIQSSLLLPFPTSKQIILGHFV